MCHIFEGFSLLKHEWIQICLTLSMVVKHNFPMENCATTIEKVKSLFQQSEELK